MFLARHAIRGRPLLVACSGGPDSLALLDALRACYGPTVIAGHVNHMLRGGDGDADEAFVVDFCRRRQIEARTVRRDIRRLAQEAGANLESTARNVRYNWLAEEARRCGAPWVATGHTADDQAETVLHNLIRGTGWRGLRGIAPRRPLASGVEVVRPLLEVTRQEVVAYLETRQLVARQDSSNQDVSLTRNRIRHELLPLLRGHFNSDIVSILGRLAEQAAETGKLQEAAALALLAAAEKPKTAEMIVLAAGCLAGAERNLVREMFHCLWEREGWPLDGMNFADWDRLAGLAFGEGTAHDLPGGVHARRKGKAVQLTRSRDL